MTSTGATSKRKWRAAAGMAWVAVLVIGLAVNGIASGKKKEQPQAAAPAVDINKLAWPPPPDVVRIKWVQAIGGEDDVTGAVAQKKKSSWMDKMAGVNLPSERGKPRLRKPYGIAVDSKGLIYVADSALAVVFVFDLDNKRVTYRGGQQLSGPIGVVIDDTDRLFVSDANQHMVYVFKPEGGLEGTFGQDKLVHPGGLAIDNENRFLYVVDTQADRVAVFDADNYKFLRYLGKAVKDRTVLGAFERPTNAAVDSDGNVYIVDTFNDRIQVFNADGDYISTFGRQGNLAGTFMRPKGIAIDGDNHLYVVDAEFNNVQMFDTEGRTLMYFGDRGYGPGAFTLATGICVDHKNRVIVSEQWNGRIQIFRYVTDKEATPEYEKLAKQREEEAKSAEAAAQQKKDSAAQ